ncbi:hypothetical protein C7N43_22325 [Sphingobacteriales bacterium UPWRP_1]|nr:hypothetical protein B6N25_07540 [Sphingobacteriales bacterium TSM_CSS]PSJ74755.1 hypothetical protein C7N43_22325 [Sphingobacteriales bacterium UPWRP_1]
MKKYILIAILAIGAIGAYIGKTMYDKPVASTADVKTEVQIDAATLFTEFEQNEQSAGDKYNDKAIAVKGTVQGVTTEGDKTTVMLNGGDMGGVSCEMQDKTGVDNLKQGDAVTIKGVCTGYLTDVILVRCVLDK